MTAFRNYVCWQSDAVLATAPRDAASLGDGHFQAVHHPLRVRRRRVDERAGGTWLEERAIVDALRGPLRRDGYLFIPIVGGSGTGKSHLVRWVKVQTDGTPGWESRYLPKNRTGIRQAIDIVTRGLTGEKIKEAREALATAPANSEGDDVLATRLVNELAILISDPANCPGVDRRQQQLRDKLARQLPSTITDPVVRKKLEAPGAVIRRLVGLTVRGRQEQDGLDDDARHISADDLPLTFSEIGQASEGARQLLGQLATIPELLAAAVNLMNEALPMAEKRVSISDQVDLVEVFRDVRRALLADRKELVLFIEDFTVLHGVEQQFLDAIVEPSHSDDGDMCNLRVIFAVTEGRFDDLDTVRTRCDDAYWLDAPYGEGGVGLEEAVSFIGRYYNSSRLEPNIVEQKWADRYGDTWLPNACTECPHQPECHSIFGTTKEGYGLYPLNEASAGRLMEALARNRYEAISESRFDPREVVRELVERLLLQSAGSLRQGKFPSEAIFAVFDRNTEPLSPVVAAEVRNRVPASYEQAINVLRYWSGESFVDTHEGILQSFGIDSAQLSVDTLPKGGEPTKSTFRRQAKGPDPEPLGEATYGIADRLGGKWRRYFDELTIWPGQNHDLSAGATNELRNLVHRTVVNNLELGPTPSHLGQAFTANRFRAERDIGFVGTVTIQDLDSVLIKIDRTNENAVALQGLLLSAEADTTDLTEAADYRRRLASNIETWTEVVSASLTSSPSQSAVSAVEGLIIASAVLGLTTGAKSPVDYLDAIFRPIKDRPPEALQRSNTWIKLLEAATTTVGRLRETVETEFGESRGVRGRLRVLQAHRLLPLVEDFVTSWKIEGSGDPAVAPLIRSVDPALKVEWGVLERQVAETGELVDRDRTWTDQTEKVLSVLRAAHNAGRLRDATAIDDLTRLAAIRPDSVQRSFVEAAHAVAEQRSQSEQLRILGSQVPDETAIVHAFVTRAAGAIDGVERDLIEREAASGATDTELIVNKVLEAVSRFAETMKELAE